MQSREQTPGNLRFHSGVCACLLCVFQRLPRVCSSIHLHVSCLLFVPLSILDVWNDTRSANCGSIELNLQRRVSAPYFLLISRQRHFFFLSSDAHVVESVHLGCSCLGSLIHCNIAHDQLVPLSFITKCWTPSVPKCSLILQDGFIMHANHSEN